MTSAPDRLWPWCLTASVVLPLAMYTLTAAPGPYWLDSGELAAAGFLAGIPHPPGHPLQTAVSGVAALVPLGSVAFRMNLISALFASLSCGALAFLARRWLLRWGVSARGAAGAGLVAALWAATSYALWFQAVRAEVYALHLFTMTLVVGLIGEMEVRAQDGDPPDRRLLYGLAFVLGLSLANHHYLVIFVGLPSLVVLMARGVWRRALLSKAGLWGVVFGLMGLGTYAFLPLRALHDPFVNWGDPDSPSRFWSVITAETFQKALGKAKEVDPVQILTDLGGQMARQLTPIGLVVALAGLGWLLADRRRRGLGLYLAAVVALNLLTQSLFNFDPHNPDVHGYFMLTVWMLGLWCALAWGGLARAANSVAKDQGERAGAAAAWIARAGGLAMVGLMGLNLWLTLPEARLDGFRDVELTNTVMLDHLPEGAVVLASNYKTHFNLKYAQGVEQRRPDIIAIYRNGLTDPVYADQIETHHPELAKLVERDDEGHTRLNFSEALTLSATRPVYAEYDVNIAPELAPFFVPDGVLMRLSDRPPGPGRLPPQMVERQIQIWDAFHDRIGLHSQGERVELETRRYLVWTHYLIARALVRAKHPGLAQFHLDRAIALNPGSPELWALVRELQGEASQ